MGLTGLEPVTSPLSGVRSSQLSYEPNRPTEAGFRSVAKTVVGASRPHESATESPRPKITEQRFDQILQRHHPERTPLAVLDHSHGTAGLPERLQRGGNRCLG